MAAAGPIARCGRSRGFDASWRWRGLGSDTPHPRPNGSIDRGGIIPRQVAEVNLDGRAVARRAGDGNGMVDPQSEAGLEH
jgi:hypothetical protein